MVKNPPANTRDAGDQDLIPGSGRSPGGVNGNPLQYSCLENLLDWGTWRAAVPGVAESRTQFSNWACTHWGEKINLLWDTRRRPLTPLHKDYFSLMVKASLVAQLVKNLPAMQETWVWSLGWEDLLEKEMAAHSSILAWRIPWTVHGITKNSWWLRHYGNYTSKAMIYMPLSQHVNYPSGRKEKAHVMFTKFLPGILLCSKSMQVFSLMFSTGPRERFDSQCPRAVRTVKIGYHH